MENKKLIIWWLFFDNEISFCWRWIGRWMIISRWCALKVYQQLQFRQLFLFIRLKIPVSSLFLIDLWLDCIPCVLSSKSLFTVFQFKGVEFDPWLSIFNSILLFLDLDFQLSLSLNQSSVFISQVNWKFSPVSSLSVFNILNSI